MSKLEVTIESNILELYKKGEPHSCNPKRECGMVDNPHQLSMNCLSCKDTGVCNHIPEVGYCCTDCGEFNEVSKALEKTGIWADVPVS